MIGKKMRVAMRLAPVAAAMLLVAGVMAQTAPAQYLAPGNLDILSILPPAPVKGEARYSADRAIFKHTRALVGSDRWRLATNDVKLTPAALTADFSCAAGMTLTPENAPATVALLTQASRETARGSQIAKDYYKRLRPFQIDRGQICQPAEELKGSYDYPSGHTTLGWTWATLLAELLPDRATAILARGRSFGESRIVCGVHNKSAVEGGYMTAASGLAAMAGSPKFQADFAAARAELAQLRATAPTPNGESCAAEAKLVALHIF